MNLFRIIFILAAGATISGTTYLSYNAVGAQDRDVSHSIRSTSFGRGLAGSVK